MAWLIQDGVLDELETIARSGMRPTDEQLERFAVAAAEEPIVAGRRISSTDGATAKIRVEGVLTERPSLLAMLLGLGGTSYQSIRAALAQADGDPEVSSAELQINSPGGNVDGLFDTLAAIQAFSKPISVRAASAESAAYAIAAVAGPIQATSPASTFGSVGVVAGFTLDDKRVQITNSDSPNKRPDVATDEGKAAVREHLDELHGLFVGAIAEGRAFHASNAGITPKVVTETFGRGATVLASRARDLKMIDGLAPQPARRARGASASASVGPQMARALRLVDSLTGDAPLRGESQTEMAQRLLAPLDARRVVTAPAAEKKDLGDLVWDRFAASRGEK